MRKEIKPIPTPTWKDGEFVALKTPTLNKELCGRIKGQAEKIYAEVDENNRFVPRGLRIGESTIACSVLPVTLENDVLTIDWSSVGGKKKTFLFKEWSYTVETATMLACYPEKKLA